LTKRENTFTIILDMKKHLQLQFFLKSPVGMLAVGIILLTALVPSFYFYQKYQETQKILQNPNAVSQKEIESLITKIGKHIVLPTGEIPTLATVSDINQLKGQEFFKNAKNGDKVLIYQNAKKAILYRPSINRIIEVGPVSLGENQNQNQATESAKVVETEPLTVTVYNGSQTAGLATTTGDKIEKQFSRLGVVGTGNARGEYSKTTVYDLTGKNKDAVSQLAKFLSGEVGETLATGEAKPSTDLLVVVVE
jgi:hypothetical protein